MIGHKHRRVDRRVHRRIKDLVSFADGWRDHARISSAVLTDKDAHKEHILLVVRIRRTVRLRARVTRVPVKVDARQCNIRWDTRLETQWDWQRRHPSIEH